MSMCFEKVLARSVDTKVLCFSSYEPANVPNNPEQPTATEQATALVAVHGRRLRELRQALQEAWSEMLPLAGSPAALRPL